MRCVRATLGEGYGLHVENVVVFEIFGMMQQKHVQSRIEWELPFCNMANVSHSSVRYSI